MVGECYNDGRCYDYLVSCSVCFCILDEPVIWQRTVLTCFRCVQRLCVDYAMFPSRRDFVQFGIQGTSVLSFDWVSYRRVCGFSVWASLVDVVDFVIVLFQSGVFEYVLFCVRVVVLVDVLGFVIVYITPVLSSRNFVVSFVVLVAVSALHAELSYIKIITRYIYAS